MRTREIVLGGAIHYLGQLVRHSPPPSFAGPQLLWWAWGSQSVSEQVKEGLRGEDDIHIYKGRPVEKLWWSRAGLKLSVEIMRRDVKDTSLHMEVPVYALTCFINQQLRLPLSVWPLRLWVIPSIPCLLPKPKTGRKLLYRLFHVAHKIYRHTRARCIIIRVLRAAVRSIRSHGIVRWSNIHMNR